MVDPVPGGEASPRWAGPVPYDLVAGERLALAEVRWGPLSDCVAALVEDELRRELPVSLCEQLVRLAAVAWNLSRRTGVDRARALARIVVEPEARPLLLELVARAEDRWPDDPRHVGAIELTWGGATPIVQCAPHLE